MKKGKKILSLVLVVLMLFSTQILQIVSFATETHTVEVSIDIVDSWNNAGGCAFDVTVYYEKNGVENCSTWSAPTSYFNGLGEGRVTLCEFEISGTPTKIHIYGAVTFARAFTFRDVKIIVDGNEKEHNFMNQSYTMKNPIGTPPIDITNCVEYNLDITVFSQNAKVLPSGYNFENDRWSFSNISEKINRQYFIDMYEEQKGQEIYEWMEDGSSHGHCFGMSVSTAATLFNAPYVTDYISWTGLPYQKLKSVNKGTSNIDMNITAKDYIKYCHIYQGSASVASQRNSFSHYGIENVYNAVRSAANNSSGTGIVIDLWADFGGHTVYAIGVDGEDILVNDSNEPGSIMRIDVDGDSWSYSGGGWTWRSENDDEINYVDDVLMPYLNITWAVSVEGKTTSSSSESNNYSEEDEINGTQPYYASSMKAVDSDKLLIVSEKEKFTFAEKESINKVRFTEGSLNDKSTELFWVDSIKTINAENIKNGPSTIKLVGDDLKITATIPESSATQMTINEDGENSISVEVKEKEDVEIVFTTLDENEKTIDVKCIATASGEEITATQTETGLAVTGVEDGTITLTKDDEVITTKTITDAESDIEITYDKNGESDDLDVQYEAHEHTYTSAVTKEATCTEDGAKTFTCSCNYSYTETIPATNHSLGAWKETKAPTCTEKGEQTKNCKNCSYSETKSVNAKGHDFNGAICKNCGADKTKDCSCNCHKTGFMGFIWKIINFFNKLFKSNPVCGCGVKHY